MRIVSLTPTASQLVVALGQKSALVGVSAACTRPDTLRGLPRMTARLPIDGPPESLQLQPGQPLLDAIAAAAPDLLLVDPSQTQQIAAGPLAALERMAVAPRSVAELMTCVGALAQRLQVAALGEELSQRLARRWKGLPGPGPEAARVAVLLAHGPLWSAGGWVPSLVEAAGGRPVLAGSEHRQVSWEDLAEADPEVLIVGTPGEALRDTMRACLSLYSHPLADRIHALRIRNVWAVDAEGLFLVPSHKLIRGAEVLRGIIGGNHATTLFDHEAIPVFPSLA